MEGWHNAITYSVLGLKQHHILKLIDGLKLEQSHTQNTNIRLDTGKTDTTKKSLYVEMDERINSILSDYSKEDLVTFFEKMTLIIE
jgi:hypothetical protein